MRKRSSTVPPGKQEYTQQKISALPEKLQRDRLHHLHSRRNQAVIKNCLRLSLRFLPGLTLTNSQLNTVPSKDDRQDGRKLNLCEPLSNAAASLVTERQEGPFLGDSHPGSLIWTWRRRVTVGGFPAAVTARVPVLGAVVSWIRAPVFGVGMQSAERDLDCRLGREYMGYAV